MKRREYGKKEEEEKKSFSECFSATKISFPFDVCFFAVIVVVHLSCYVGYYIKICHHISNIKNLSIFLMKIVHLLYICVNEERERERERGERVKAIC